MKKKLAVSGVVIGASAYLFMVISTIMGTGEGASFTTFALWSALAWIAGFTMMKQGANPGVPMMYGFGAASTALALLCKGKVTWSGLDTITTVMVAICIILWLTSGPRRAMIMSIVAGVVGGIPFIIMTWKSPAASPFIPSSGFLLANLLFFLSGKKWTLEDRLYGGVNVIVTSLLVIPWLIYFFNN